MRQRLFCAILLLAATTAFGQPKFTVTPVPGSVTVPPGGTATGTVKVKYECNNCTTPYSGGWELFEGVSSGFELSGNPTFACDPGPSCSVTTNPNCVPVDPQFGQIGCFGQATLAPGAVVTESQAIKQQTGGPTTGNWNVHVGNDVDSTFVVVPLGTGGAVCPDITILPATLPDLTVGGSLPNIQFTATGGNAPYTFSAPKDVAPGLTIEYGANPFLAGKPTTAGTYTFTVTAKDSTPAPPGPCTASKTYTLTVKPAASCPTITMTTIATPDALPDFTVGVPMGISPVIVAKGGQFPYKFQVTGLPAGMFAVPAIEGDAVVIAGIPTAAGNYTITVTATDSTPAPPGPCSATKTYTLKVNAPTCPTIMISPATLPEMTVGVPLPDVTAPPHLRVSIDAAGGAQPYTFKVSGLPPGVTYASGIAHVDLEGTPTTAGTYNVNVTVTDSTASPPGPCTASKSYTLTIKPAAEPHFVITKSVNTTAPDLGIDGSFLVTYTLKVTNDSSAPGTATVHDIVYGSTGSGSKPSISTLSDKCNLESFGVGSGVVVCHSESIAPGASQSFSFNVIYHPPHLRSYLNRALVTTDQVGSSSESNTTKINLTGILERFLVPAEKDPSLANNKGR